MPKYNSIENSHRDDVIPERKKRAHKAGVDEKTEEALQSELGLKLILAVSLWHILKQKRGLL